MPTGNPNWQAAVARAQAPQLPVAIVPLPVEERFDQVHAYHGQFGVSGGTKHKGGKGGGGKGGAGGGKHPAPAGNTGRKARLLARAHIDLQQAAVLKVQLVHVEQQIQFATTPVPVSQSTAATAGQSGGSTAAAGGAGATTGGPATTAAAKGTKSFGTGTKSFSSGTPKQQTPVSQYLRGLYRTAATLRSQISGLESAAAALTARAARIK